jgi:hypothetical protein
MEDNGFTATVDRDYHKGLAGHVTCIFCIKTIKEGVGIIRFPNGFQEHTHKKCLEDTERRVTNEELLKRVETICNLITKSNAEFATLYLETVPRSFVTITHEEADARPLGEEPFTVFDQTTKKRITLQRVDCGLGCKCALKLVRVEGQQ